MDIAQPPKEEVQAQSNSLQNSDTESTLHEKEEHQDDETNIDAEKTAKTEKVEKTDQADGTTDIANHDDKPADSTTNPQDHTDNTTESAITPNNAAELQQQSSSNPHPPVKKTRSQAEKMASARAQMDQLRRTHYTVCGASWTCRDVLYFTVCYGLVLMVRAAMLHLITISINTLQNNFLLPDTYMDFIMGCHKVRTVSFPFMCICTNTSPF